MPTLAMLLSLLLSNSFATSELVQDNSALSRQSGAVRQLLAVRGEIVKIKRNANGFISITIKPAKEFAEATVVARENDPVGTGVGRSGDSDLIGLLTGDVHDDETISAAELSEGDVVSVIYDPQSQNRVIEIYLHS
jgi:DNA-directed RNA polymerase subunit H (RpoH/RPB5)